MVTYVKPQSLGVKTNPNFRVKVHYFDLNFEILVVIITSKIIPKYERFLSIKFKIREIY